MCHLGSFLGKGHIIYEEEHYRKGQMTHKRGYKTVFVVAFLVLTLPLLTLLLWWISAYSATDSKSVKP